MAGVSRATVSRVVNGNPKVGTEAKRQVERAIERLGYVPNQAARSLVTRRSQSIGLVIPEPAGRLFEDPSSRVSSAGSVRRSPRATCSWSSSCRSRRRGGARRALPDRRARGRRTVVSLHGNDPLPQAVAGRGVPVVVGGRPPRGSEVSYVDVDNVQGARSAVEHLISTGRKVIATIAGPQDMPAGEDRLAGYHDALETAGFARDAKLSRTAISPSRVARAARRILAARPISMRSWPRPT